MSRIFSRTSCRLEAFQQGVDPAALQPLWPIGSASLRNHQPDTLASILRSIPRGAHGMRLAFPSAAIRQSLRDSKTAACGNRLQPEQIDEHRYFSAIRETFRLQANAT